MDTPHVLVLYTKITGELSANGWNTYLDKLSQDLRDKATSYVNWKDQHAYVFGKLLLMKAIAKYGYPPGDLSGVQYTTYRRPYLSADFDFNISHSGEYVMCAIGEGLRLGIDIEAIRSIDFEDFRNVMAPREWKDIHNAKHPITTFFRYWTIKESAIKADGRGLSVPLLEVQVQNGHVQLGDASWYYQEFHHIKDSCLSIATDHEKFTVDWEEVYFYD